LVGLDLDDRLALAYSVAGRLEPADDLAGLLGHLERGHDDVGRHQRAPPSTSRAATRARSIPAASTSRWVTARIVRGPRAPMRIPRARRRSTKTGAAASPASSKNTMLVSTVDGSRVTPGSEARPSARRRAFA